MAKEKEEVKEEEVKTNFEVISIATAVEPAIKNNITGETLDIYAVLTLILNKVTKIEESL